MRRIGSLSLSGLAGMVLVTALILGTAACTVTVTGREQANAAWSARLAGQALDTQQQGARREQARQAWVQRLTGQAAAYEAEQASKERARQAWSDRLTKLAEYLQDGGGMLGPAD